jgi:proton-dependent oligopeptide transporter, POT family
LENTTTLQQKGHPPGLYLLFTVEMWERFSYYGMRAILTLYITASVIENGLGWDAKTASIIYGWFTGFVYLTPIIGGWLADNYIGKRRAITIGGLMMMSGQFMLAAHGFIPGVQEMTFWLGLSMLALGNGFFKPNISSVVGELYKPGDIRRDSAFAIFYMGINLGALLAPLVMGVVTGKDIGYHYGFLAAGIGMLIGQVVYNLLGNKFLGDLAVEPEAKRKRAEKAAGISGSTSLALNKEENDRLWVIYIIVAFTTFFWMGFEQAGSSLNLYTRDYIDRSVNIDLGFKSFTEVPTAFFQAFNPLLIVLLAPIFSVLWIYLEKRNLQPSTPVKISLGIILLGVGFLFMVAASLERGVTMSQDVTDTAIKASMTWLLLAYLFHTLGELCLSPVGLSMITKLSPTHMVSLMMGVWFAGPFVANVAGGYVSALVQELGALQVFGLIAAFSIFMGLILLALSGKLKQMMHGVK